MLSEIWSFQMLIPLPAWKSELISFQLCVNVRNGNDGEIFGFGRNFKTWFLMLFRTAQDVVSYTNQNKSTLTILFISSGKQSF